MSVNVAATMVDSIDDLLCLPEWPTTLSISTSTAEALNLAEGSSEHVQELYESIYDYKRGTRYYYLYFRFRNMPNDRAYQTQFKINACDELGWLDDRIVCHLVERRQVTTLQWADVEP